MESIDTEPKSAHCAIRYQYNYHLDREMEIPNKLQAWAQHRSQPYLAKHAFVTFQVDTKRSTWKEYSRLNSLPNPWAEVGPKQKKKPKIVNPYKKPHSMHGTVNKPTTIPEEESVTSTNTSATTPPTLSGQKRTKDDASVNSSTDGKMSAILPESNNQMCQYATEPSESFSAGKSPLTYPVSHPNPLNFKKKFTRWSMNDEDGFIYDWNTEGTDKHNVVSKLSPSELRNYLPSTINISADGKITVQLRFGFFGNTPAIWRNSPSTKEKLQKYEVTVAISNSTSTSGNLMIAGYILLKAPMTTHCLRYLQYLRQSLPENTPPFDILLHNRSPASNEVTPHLAVQCGKKHVHALSEALCPLLTGDNSALYMPRSLLSDMPDEKVIAFFKQHDVYCKNLRSHPLSPLLRNIDKPRKEFNPNGSLVSIERTAREWARSLKPNNTDPVQFDVVNGGPDQLAYLIFPSQYADLAAQHVDTYRNRLYPRRKREDKFKVDAGPPTTVHLSRRVIANLEFMEKCCSRQQDKSTTQAASSESKTTDDHSKNSASTTSSVTQVSRPLTPRESLRQQLDKRIASLEATPSSVSDEPKQSSSTVNSDDTSLATTASENSKASDRLSETSDEVTLASTVSEKSKVSGRMSTSSAKVRQLDEVLQRFKSDSAQTHAKQSDRVSQIERQVQRVHEFDSKLDAIQTDFVSRMNLLEGRIEETMNNNMAKLITLVQSMNPGNAPSTPTRASTNYPQTSPSPVDNTTLQQLTNPDSDGSSTMASLSSSSKASGLSDTSSDPMQSPEHKKLKSTGKVSKKKALKDSIRRRLDEIKDSQSIQSPISPQASTDSFDQIAEEMDVIMAPSNNSDNIPPSTESQYTAASPGNTVDTQATSFPGRVSNS